MPNFGRAHRLGREAWRAALLAAVALAGGCTMCPDPLDYSGPVPNGSTPQNNFWARSNGILPLNAAPRPWPPVVQSPGSGSGPAPKRVAALAVAAAGRDEPDEPDEGEAVLVSDETAVDPGGPDAVSADGGELVLGPARGKDVTR